MQSKILSSPDKEHLLTIALDGENCWENYMEDGASFLKTLYTLITEDETLETVLISEYLDKTKEDKTLTKIASGSWINRNFKLWILLQLWQCQSDIHLRSGLIKRIRQIPG